MKAACCLLLLVGCGERGTSAPGGCPASGAPLQMQPIIHPLPQMCTQYTESLDAGIAVALCGAPPAIYQWDIGGPLEPMTDLVGTEPILTPEGDRLILQYGDPQAQDPNLRTRFSTYRRDATGAWIRDDDQQIAITAPDRSHLSTLTRRDVGRVILYDATSSGAVLRELAADGNRWTETASYSAQDLGVVEFAFEAPWLSADGLRLVVRAITSSAPDTYAFVSLDRSGLQARFQAPPQQLDFIPPGATTPFVREDCSRIYFSGDGALFYEDAP